MNDEPLTDRELGDILRQLDDIQLMSLAARFCGTDEAGFIRGVRGVNPDALPERLRDGSTTS